MTVTVNVPVADGVHVRVDVPELVRLDEVRLQLIPADGDADVVSETVPESPFKNPTVMVEVAVEPVATESVVGLAVSEKSCIV